MRTFESSKTFNQTEINEKFFIDKMSPCKESKTLNKTIFPLQNQQGCNSVELSAKKDLLRKCNLLT